MSKIVIPLTRLLLLLVLLLLPSIAWADYQSVVAADSPTHWYHFNELSGTTATDAGSGSAANGTYTGVYTLGATGFPGNGTNTAVSVAGAGYVALTNNSDLSPGATSGAGNGWNAEIWINPTAVASQSLQSDNNGVTQFNFQVRLFANGAINWLQWSAASSCGGGIFGNITSSTSAYAAGQWQYLVLEAVGNGGANGFASMSVYLNTVQVATTTSFSGTMCSSSAAYRVGSSLEDATFFNGTMAEYAVYKNNSGSGGAPLTGAKQTAHYNAGIAAGLPIIPRRIFQSKRERIIDRVFERVRFGLAKAPPLTVDAPTFVLDRLERQLASVQGQYAR